MHRVTCTLQLTTGNRKLVEKGTNHNQQQHTLATCVMKIDVSQGALISKDAVLKLAAPLHATIDYASELDLEELDVTIRVGADTIFHPSSSFTVIVPSMISKDRAVVFDIGPKNVFHEQCRITIDLSDRNTEENSLLMIGEGNLFESKSHVRCNSIASFNVFSTYSRVRVDNILDGCVITPAINYSANILENETVIYFVDEGILTRKHLNGRERNQVEICAYVSSMKDIMLKNHTLIQ